MISAERRITAHRKFILELLLFIAALALVVPRDLLAHPMGNFSISHFAGLRIEAGQIDLRYILDLAEIPTFQEIQAAGIVAAPDDPRVIAYLESKAEVLKRGLQVTLNGQPLSLETVTENVIFPPGAGNLPTMKIGVVYRAAITGVACPCALEYHDNNFPGHAGWKEVVVTAAPETTLGLSTARGVSRSQELANYPTDLINSPPQDLEANVTFSVPSFVSAAITAGDSGRTIERPVSSVRSATIDAAIASKTPRVERAIPQSRAAAANETTNQTRVAARVDASGTIQLNANQQATPRNAFTELMTRRQLSFSFLVAAVLLAIGLGALHALEPGHGKTIVAAYLVGSRGTPTHAVLLGIIVTAAHTTGVYLLGAVTLYASRFIVPERLYPWLGVTSGLMIATLASFMLVRALTVEEPEHDHVSGRAHRHWFTSLGKRGNTDFTSDAGNARSAQAPVPGDAKISLAQLLTLGITGGMVPCPAALVVLLSAISLNRVGVGLLLIIAFSCGLAAVLIGIGLLMVCGRRLMMKWRGEGAVAKRWLPAVSAGFMAILGVGIAARAFLTTAIGAGFVAREHLGSVLGVVLLGLFLGMRHSTDPDHVVAVSTIVSRERSVRQGALIGALWGIGHTLTIFFVGSAIILFGLVIPPRIGLSMEFAVAAMLILLGVLNLTGLLGWITRKLAPPADAREASPLAAECAQKPASGSVENFIGRYGLFQFVRPLFVGLVHGLAGSAAVALLVLSTIRSPLWATAYLVVFGLGTVVGMMLMTSAMAVPFACTGRYLTRFAGYLGTVSGLISTAFGIFLVYQIGIVDGLFTAQVHWIPR
jgi:ABC-type nickel/cobalt efflux system permease component RcnA